MAKATKTKSGFWRCKAYYTDAYGRYRSKSFTCPTKKEAEYFAAGYKMMIKQKKKPENVSLGELVDRYITNRENVLSVSTVAGYRKIRRNAFRKIMDTRSGFITTQMYQSAINEYSKGRSPKTIKEAHRLVFRVMKENGLDIDEKLLVLPQNIKKDIVIPTTEEVILILEKSADKGIYLQVAMAALMGMRRSEIFALTWNDIDTEKRTIVINKAKVKDEFNNYIIKSPKTYHSKRVIEMPIQIVNALPERGKFDEEIFKISVDASDSRYKRLVASLGMKCSFHSLRHYYASYLLAKGMPNKYAMENMGHATENMLKKVYQHTFEKEHEKFNSIIQEAFNESGF